MKAVEVTCGELCGARNCPVELNTTSTLTSLRLTRYRVANARVTCRAMRRRTCRRTVAGQLVLRWRPSPALNNGETLPIAELFRKRKEVEWCIVAQCDELLRTEEAMWQAER